MTVVAQVISAFLVAAAVQAYSTQDNNLSLIAIDSDEPIAFTHNGE